MNNIEQTITVMPPAGKAVGGAKTYVFWSVLGGIFLVLQIYAYAAWITSPDFRPTLPGPDPIPPLVRYSTIGYEIFAMATLIPALIWFVHGIWRSGKIDTTRAMMVGWLSAYWLDPFLSFLRPMFLYNASAFNYGCWCRFIPFWHTPHGARIAEPLLIIAPSYFYTFTATALIALWAMKQARRQWPGIGILGLALAGFVGIWLTMEILDVVATRFMGLDAWLGSFRAVSLWAGTAYQFPIYELVLFPAPFVACAFLLYHVDAGGYTVIERGVAGAGGGQWRRNGLRLLTFIAFCNLMNLIYTTSMGIAATAADPWPAGVPSWLMDGQCGTGTGIICQP
jgi:hypothetical protein